MYIYIKTIKYGTSVLPTIKFLAPSTEPGTYAIVIE